jgi:hypothetical protein
MVHIEPQWIVAEFLRARLTDPRGTDRSENSTTETLTANTSQTEFSLTPPSGSMSAITAVTVDGSTKNKWEDFYPDTRNDKIVFFSGLSGGEEVAITYKYGTSNWIYPDRPRKDLAEDSFPRIRVFDVSGPGTRLGNYEADIEYVMRFQADIYVKDVQNTNVFTIDGNKYSGINLCRYIAFQIIKAFKSYESDLFPAMYGYTVLQIPTNQPFDKSLQAHRVQFDFELRTINAGLIE